MSKLRLTFACGPYDRTQALRDGSLQPEGIDLNYLALQPAEIFWRMLQYREFDASEMSLSNYTSLVSDGNAPFIAIPAFPSRVFRHGYFFINTDKGIRHPGDFERIFDPFYTTKSHGMGMGLSICRSIIEVHGGRLTVARGEPDGAVFQVMLPAGGSGPGR